MFDIYGADAARIFVLFAAPIENELVWHESGIEGAVTLSAACLAGRVEMDRNIATPTQTSQSRQLYRLKRESCGRRRIRR